MAAKITARGLTVFRGVLRCPFRAILLENGHFSPLMLIILVLENSLNRLWRI
jgi:hypothetical protein